MPKHSSVTNADIGKIVMQRTSFINFPPESIEDIESLIYVCDTSPAETGTKGRWNLSFSPNYPLPPLTQIIRVTFIGDILPIYGHRWNFGSSETFGVLTFLPNNISPIISDGQINFGNNLDDLISNIQNYFNTQNTTLTQNVRFLATGTDSDNHKWIDFEFYLADTNSQYTVTHSITFEHAVYSGNIPPGFEGSVFLDFALFDINSQQYGYMTDNWGNSVTISTDTAYDVNGYVQVLSLQSTTLGLLNTAAGIVSGTNLYFKDEQLYLGVIGDYNLVTSMSRLDTGQWVLGTQGAYSATVQLVFPQYILIEDYYASSYTQSLTPDRVNVAEDISNRSQSYDYVIEVDTWDTNNGYQAFLVYFDLYSYASTIPYGTVGPYNLKYFSSIEEYKDAINWAVLNGQYSHFSEIFNVVEPLAYDADNNIIKMVIESLTAPSNPGDSAQFVTSVLNPDYPVATVTTNIEPVARKPERITGSVVGVLVGTEGNNAIIDSTFINTVKMCSAADGAFGALPYTEEIQTYHSVLAWRDGKVIDFFGWSTVMNNSGWNISENIISYWLFSSGFFVPMSAALPEADLFVKPSTSPLFFGQ